MGGDDITEFLYVLLQRIRFPYRTLDLNRSYDWAVLEDLKGRLCTLLEVSETVAGMAFIQMITNGFKSDVALNLYDFIVRRPNAATEKYGLRAYDEIILAPMVCIDRPFRFYVPDSRSSAYSNRGSLISNPSVKVFALYQKT